MANSDVEELTQRTLKSGGLLVKLYFDMQSEKEEELQPLMTDLINNRLLKSPGVIYCTGSIDVPMKLKDVFSTNAVVSALFKDIGALINVVFNFAPVGIEIMKPEDHYTVKISALNAVLVSMSQISAEYSKYILTKVLSKEDLEKLNTSLSTRAAMGKKLLDDSNPKQGS